MRCFATSKALALCAAVVCEATRLRGGGKEFPGAPRDDRPTQRVSLTLKKTVECPSCGHSDGEQEAPTTGETTTDMHYSNGNNTVTIPRGAPAPKPEPKPEPAPSFPGVGQRLDGGRAFDPVPRHPMFSGAGERLGRVAGPVPDAGPISADWPNGNSVENWPNGNSA